jgi:ADP-heptose:LPS heptosyltransferase
VNTPLHDRVLIVRLDSDGDVLLAGPAIRAVARWARVSLLVSPQGEQAARLLPGVAEILTWPCPWTGFDPPPVDPPSIRRQADALRRRRFQAAIVLTSDHQSALPAALLLRLAGVRWIGAVSRDYPGSLLDLRHAPAEGHEVERALDLVTACGFPPDPADDGRLAVQPPDAAGLPVDLPATPFVVVHPGASVPARAPGAEHAAQLVKALDAAGWAVVVTGGPGERELTREVSAGVGADLGGRTSLADLAVVLGRASCVVVGNTGPAHLAAAVGTPVVSLFSPVVPAGRWRPWKVPVRVLGDQAAPCRDSRARSCPVPGHPCLSGVSADQVVAAVHELAAPPRPACRDRHAPHRPGAGR